jgi:hypothetical protein
MKKIFWRVYLIKLRTTIKRIKKGNLTTKKNIETLEDKRSAIKDFLTNPDKKEIACLEIN